MRVRTMTEFAEIVAVSGRQIPQSTLVGTSDPILVFIHLLALLPSALSAPYRFS